jgi:hypothetical protein
VDHPGLRFGSAIFIYTNNIRIRWAKRTSTHVTPRPYLGLCTTMTISLYPLEIVIFAVNRAESKIPKVFQGLTSSKSFGANIVVTQSVI